MNLSYFLLGLGAVVALPFIAVADYLLFNGLMICRFCGKNNAKGKIGYWMPACAIEFLMLLAGIMMGLAVRI
jgi:hypothetical protein